ncbi:unnamed protein product [Amoebophrya sp. A120]|nr:unnamed protein product [Amoebophrya sp. A120]|eukprot:GSA120T00008948001.1
MDSLTVATQHVISQRQEELWADAKIDGRAVFSKRESYKLHKPRLVSLQQDIARILLLVRASLSHEFVVNTRTSTKNSCTSSSSTTSGECDADLRLRIADEAAPPVSENIFSRFFGGDIGVLTHVANHLAGVGLVLGFFQKCYELVLRRKNQKNDHGEQLEASGSEGKNSKTPEAAPENSTHRISSKKINLILRKRPLLSESEIQQNEWSVVSKFEQDALHVCEGRVAYNNRRLQLHLSHHYGDKVLCDEEKLLSADCVRNSLEKLSEFCSCARPPSPGGRAAISSSYVEGKSCDASSANMKSSASSSTTYLCYGQTGSGKTFTMKELVHDVFGKMQELREDRNQDNKDHVVDSPTVRNPNLKCRMQCFEVLHKQNTVFDLLSQRKKVKILEDEFRKVHVKAKWEEIDLCLHAGMNASEGSRSTSSWQHVFDIALQERLSEATERNANSSRSHAFFVFEFYYEVDGEEDADASSGANANATTAEVFSTSENKTSKPTCAYDEMTRPGEPLEDEPAKVKLPPRRRITHTVRIIDLAGSERNFETQQMTAEQHRHSAMINSSLMTLKTCMRLLAAEQTGSASSTSGGAAKMKKQITTKIKIPFRESRLTHLLQDCFQQEEQENIKKNYPLAEQVDSVDVEQVKNRSTHCSTSNSLIIIACISPSARDAVHSRNTLSHVCEMVYGENCCPETVLDLPITLSGHDRKRVEDWSEEDVQNWLGSVASGRFARIVLPDGFKDGKGLVKLCCGTAASKTSARPGFSTANNRVMDEQQQQQTSDAEVSASGSGTTSSSSSSGTTSSATAAGGTGDGSATTNTTSPAAGVERDEQVEMENQSFQFYQIFETDQLRKARVTEEGASWNIAGPEQVTMIMELFRNLVLAEVKANTDDF